MYKEIIQCRVSKSADLKSILNLAVYSSYEDAETNLSKRKEFQDILKNKFTVVDSFYYEGDITYFENSKADEIKVERKS